MIWHLASPGHSSKGLWGIITRTGRCGLSWCGRILVLGIVLLIFCLLLLRVYPFLAMANRVTPNVLVVEGWVHEHAIRTAVQEFRSHSYERVFTTGGPVEGIGSYINDYQT